nr:unnamed protein product [Callosobruchus analis]
MDSDDYSSEDTRRKRQAEEMLFSRSKKTYRSPDKPTKNDEKLDICLKRDLVEFLKKDEVEIEPQRKAYRRKIKSENS